MSETRDAALVRNALAILGTLDLGEVDLLSETEWEKMQRDPRSFFLRTNSAQRAALWEAMQRRLPKQLREVYTP